MGKPEDAEQMEIEAKYSTAQVHNLLSHLVEEAMR